MTIGQQRGHQDARLSGAQQPRMDGAGAAQVVAATTAAIGRGQRPSGTRLLMTTGTPAARARATRRPAPACRSRPQRRHHDAPCPGGDAGVQMQASPRMDGDDIDPQPGDRGGQDGGSTACGPPASRNASAESRRICKVPMPAGSARQRPAPRPARRSAHAARHRPDCPPVRKRMIGCELRPGEHHRLCRAGAAIRPAARFPPSRRCRAGRRHRQGPDRPAPAPRRR